MNKKNLLLGLAFVAALGACSKVRTLKSDPVPKSVDNKTGGAVSPDGKKSDKVKTEVLIHLALSPATQEKLIKTGLNPNKIKAQLVKYLVDGKAAGSWIEFSVGDSTDQTPSKETFSIMDYTRDTAGNVRDFLVYNMFFDPSDDHEISSNVGGFNEDKKILELCAGVYEDVCSFERIGADKFNIVAGPDAEDKSIDPDEIEDLLL